LLVCEGLTHQFMRHGRPNVLFRNLSFDLEPGGRLAILGRNGQGKSTLLKILGGVQEPTAGRVAWGDTHPSWPIGFSGAFQGSLTGLDNILFISRLYRKSAEDVWRRTEEFAELGEALTQPVKQYSTGMRARLAFGLSLAIDFDYYLIDEVIVVGDARFQKKCHDELFNKRGQRAFIVATHDFNFVAEMCERAIVIESGRAMLYDNVTEAIEVATGIQAQPAV
jgi:capsular polysaccharide transport system ATP-binding protein